MSLRMEGWQSLEPKVRSLWLAQAGIGSVFYAILFLGGDVVVRMAMDERWPLPPFMAGALLLILFASLSLFLASRKYDYWKYRLGDDDLAVGYGILWRTRRFISRARIQHVDISAGVIARSLGICEVSVFVGGQMSAAATIPGLRPEEAERLRGVLLDKPPVGAFSEAEQPEEAPAPPPLSGEPSPTPTIPPPVHEPPVNEPTAQVPPPIDPYDPLAPPRREEENDDTPPRSEP